MELIMYLNEYFFTKQELLDMSKVTEQDFLKYQQQRVMPKCSYKLSLNLKSDSFFGLYNNEQEVEYYAKGYASWLAVIQSVSSTEAVYSVFAERYKRSIECLKEQGHCPHHLDITSALNDHIKQEWTHFLDGIYGLCTKSGLPEDIAAKELSILEINVLLEINLLTDEQINRLTVAVNLLDSVSSLFAPHERLQSSRHRLVSEVRRNYKF
ncbi:hypothetical protein HQQ94_21025 [Shewanella sp. VB17]|uniref:DUF6058 family natural product biosynthesis protein n=1 Tax=Shewanella sp. VB17 TaxID=2739432 RepID=UPI001565B9C2|nr:DUF6058 family natural product biosynthesis protein [Shewanella sp. VB17]NRD75658.1 hypothetical protein [Shewanella sp. VB17]